ncbi:alanine racemase [Microbacterium gilvum]|uniref:Alanine racemase n=1 Tax=Microbacterium gilvum TaxID=1336204 RepID=A0ABP8ZU86_9MICO
MTELRIDLARLRANVRAVAERVAPAALLVVVKDDAYGHGVEPVVAAALDERVSWFGAIDVPSAARAKAAAGERARVFCWATLPEEAVAGALDAGLELGVGDAGYLERVARIASGRGAAAPVHLKIDTGLHRNGVRPEEWPSFTARAAALERDGAIRVVGLWSHISEASDAEDDLSRAVFEEAGRVALDAGLRPDVRHLAASAAAWHRPAFRGDLVRIGAFCYGVRSAGDDDIPGVAPAASLVADVVGIGAEGVEIGVGWLDGVFSTLAGRIEVGTPAGARTLLDVAETTSTVASWPGAAVGDKVVVFGPGTTGEWTPTSVGEAAGTVGEEPLLRLSPLIPRVHVD